MALWTVTRKNDDTMLRSRAKGLRQSRHGEFADEREELGGGEKEKKMETVAGLCL